MRIVATRKSQQNQAMIDPWTAVHLAAGLAAGLMQLSRRWSISAATAYEVVEQYVERQRWGRELFATKRHESVPNAIVDVAVFAIGHRLGEMWNDMEE